jgi:hypothetical protein
MRDYSSLPEQLFGAFTDRYFAAWNQQIRVQFRERSHNKMTVPHPRVRNLQFAAVDRSLPEQ